jgi:hypothetical protein
MITAKVGAIDKKIKRLNNLKGFYRRMMMGYNKKDSIRMIVNFQTGIRGQSLGLKRLTEFTVKDKSRMGLSRPDVPLYGMGDDLKDTLINSLRIKKTKNGFKVYASDNLHHEETNESQTLANLPMSALLTIHEHGCTIPVTKKQRWFLAFKKGLFLKATTQYITIPPRPAFKKAGIKTRREKKEEAAERSKKMTRAMIAYVETNQTVLMNRIMGFVTLGKKYEET